MVFSSAVFVLLFLPAFLFSYFIAEKIGKISIKNAVILLFSLAFYAWGGLKYLILVIILVFINYIFALLIEKLPNRKKLFLFGCIFIDLTNLVFYKYFGFFCENLTGLFSRLGLTILDGVALQIVMPIGISFYTFQIMSYVIDVYRGDVPAQKSYPQLLMYIIMFPQLIAGPIVRYSDINEKIACRHTTVEDTTAGIKRFILGLFKKVFLANTTGGIADIVFAQYQNLNSVYLLLGVLSYALQIYYDFSAYSDMAIGLGHIMGFKFNENFDNPYISKSIKEFWRRWHISLSSWFRDYLYIPLGGNRKGVRRTYINLIIVFFVTGFWHGAAWQFVFWGLFHGFFMIVERMGFEQVLKKLPNFVQHLYCLIIVLIGWIFFRADNMTVAAHFIRNIFTFNFANWGNIDLVLYFTPINIVCYLIALIGIFSTVHDGILRTIKKNSVAINTVYILIYGFTVIYLIGLDYNPFIYFKF